MFSGDAAAGERGMAIEQGPPPLSAEPDKPPPPQDFTVFWGAAFCGETFLPRVAGTPPLCTTAPPFPLLLPGIPPPLVALPGHSGGALGLACSRNTTTGDTAVAQATKKGNHFPVGKASVDWVQSHGHRAPSPARKWETDVLGDGLFGESTTASLARHDPADATMLGSTSVTMSLMRRLAEGRSVVPTPPMAANGMRSPPGRQYENGLGRGGIRPRTTGGRAGTTRTTLWTKQGKPPAVDLTGDGCVEENPGPRDRPRAL